MVSMPKEEAVYKGRQFYREFGIPVKIDTIKFRPDGDVSQSGVPATEADSWAVFFLDIPRILYPMACRGKKIGEALEGVPRDICDRCDSFTRRGSQHMECCCVVPCGEPTCDAPRYEEPRRTP